MKERKEKRIKKRWNRVAWMNEEGWEVEEESIFIISHVRSIWKKKIERFSWSIEQFSLMTRCSLGKMVKQARKEYAKLKQPIPQSQHTILFPSIFLLTNQIPSIFFLRFSKMELQRSTLEVHLGFAVVCLEDDVFFCDEACGMQKNSLMVTSLDSINSTHDSVIGSFTE